jgi:hypothetical protein
MLLAIVRLYASVFAPVGLMGTETDILSNIPEFSKYRNNSSDPSRVQKEQYTMQVLFVALKNFHSEK